MKLSDLTELRSLAELRDRQQQVKERIAALHREFGTTPLDGEARGEMVDLVETNKQIRERIEEYKAREQLVDRLIARGNPDNFDGPEHDAHHMGRPGEPAGIPARDEARNRALRANERADFLPEASRAHMERSLRGDDDGDGRLAQYVVSTANRDYFRAFSKWLRDPVSGGHEWTPQEREAVQQVRMLERSMSLLTGGAGGFLVPYELDPSIVLASAGYVDPMREVSRVETTAFNEKRFVTSLGVASAWYAEEAEVADNSAVLLQPAITYRKAMSFIPVSFELFEDSGIAQEVGKLFADSKAAEEARVFTTGNGTTEPTGIITALVAAGGATVIATGTNVLDQGDLYANQAALPARWRPNAKWTMNLNIVNGYRQLPQATGLNYSIINDDGPRPKALGWEIFENNAMDATLTGAAADYLVLSGDFQQFAIVDRVGATLEVVPQLMGANRRPSGQRGFLLHWRVGSDVLVPDAFRLSNFET